MLFHRSISIASLVGSLAGLEIHAGEVETQPLQNERGQGIAAATVAANSDYLRALESLLHRAKADGVQLAEEVIERAITEMKGLHPTEVSLVGEWLLHSRQIAKFTDDGEVAMGEKTGKWRWLDEEERIFEVDWGSKVDTAKVSGSGETIEGTGKSTGKTIARRQPIKGEDSEEPAEGYFGTTMEEGGDIPAPQIF